MQIKNTVTYPLYTCEDDHLKKQKKPTVSVGKNIENKEPLYTVGGDIIGAATMEISKAVLKEVKRTTTQPSNPKE
jgi:hypothetical protein